jgi:outer membrane protein assembly factor BamA
MLGERRLGAAVQIGSNIRDAAFELRFLNQERRWNWGAVAELQPGLWRYRRNQTIEHDGEAALLKQADYLQRMQLRTAALLAYPFNRGLRVELTGGVRHERYQRELRSNITSAATGRVLAADSVTSSGGEPTTVAELSAALVHDTTVFGMTGPLIGSRYRFEVAPAVGKLSYTRVVADYRRYLMPVRPYSVAIRGLHVARYGRDSDDPRLVSNYLGSNNLVRGYQLDVRYCPADPARVCGDELLGSRVLVSNVEFRVPVWGVVSRRLEYGRVPADAFVFADSGLVWSSRKRANAISSVGAGIRLNAGGLPFEFVMIRALDGPPQGWQPQFGFRVGF